MKKVVVIGSSTGGPSALQSLVSALPKSINVPVLIAQHLTKEYTRRLAQRLDSISNIAVSLVSDGELLSPGRAYVVPGDHHFFLTTPGPRIVLIQAHEYPKPSIDMGFTSVAEHFGPATLGVILTGMGDDGLIGAKTIKRLGGMVIVQDESTSTVYGMPKAVRDAGFADEALPLNAISKRILELVAR